MKLDGWTTSLPEYIVKAIEQGKLKVCQAKDYQYLQGIVVNPQGTIIEFK